MSVSINNPNQKSVCPTTRSLPIMISLHLQRMAAFHAASMCEDMCACGKICAASARSKKIQVTSWAQTSRPPRSAPRSALRTKRPFVSAAIAFAAFARARSTGTSAVQRFSPNRPFKQADTDGIQTALSLHSARNRRMRDKPAIQSARAIGRSRVQRSLIRGVSGDEQ